MFRRIGSFEQTHLYNIAIFFPSASECSTHRRSIILEKLDLLSVVAIKTVNHPTQNDYLVQFRIEMRAGRIASGLLFVLSAFAVVTIVAVRRTGKFKLFIYHTRLPRVSTPQQMAQLRFYLLCTITSHKKAAVCLESLSAFAVTRKIENAFKNYINH